MRGLNALAWRGLRARPLRVSLTIIGVALGVSVLFAGLATDAGIDAAIERSVQTLTGRADLRVSAFGETGLTPDTLAAIGSTQGIAVAAPALERRTYLGLELFAPGDDLPPPVMVVGVDPDREGRVHDLDLAAGAPLAAGGEASALVSATLARDDQLSIGAALTVQGPGDPMTFRVVGILATDGPWGGGGRTVVVPLASAQAAFDDPGITRVDILVTDGMAPAAVAAALQANLLTQPYVLSSPRDLAATMRASTGDFAATTALLAAIALFAGAFLIFNTLSMTVIERIRELGLLRAAGATSGQVTAFILVQATAIGVVGSLLGLGLGALLASLMAMWVGTVGAVQLGEPVVTAAHVLAALGIGVAVTLAAALEPARRAGRIAPVEALKARLDLPTARRARMRWLIVVFALVGVTGLLIWPRGAGEVALVRALVVYATLLLVALVVPFLLPVLVRLAGVPFRIMGRLEVRLARASFLRDRSRSALTVGALTIGLAMIVALGGVGQHARAAAAAWIEDVIPGDLVVTSIFPRSLDEGLVEVLGAASGVASVSPFASFDLAIDGIRLDGAAMSGADLAVDGRLRFVDGARASALAALDDGGAAIVPAGIARRDGIAVGDTLTAAAVDGSVLPLRVVGVVERTLPGSIGESIVVGWPDADRLGIAGADAFAVRYAQGASIAQRDALADQARSLALEPVSLVRIEGVIGEALDRVFGLFDVLALVAVIVAALGIVNTLTMNVLERVREIGVLRAAGMTRRQVWRSVVVEAGMTGLVGALCGVVAGVGVGILMVLLGGGRLEVALAIPWPTVGLALVLGVVLAMLAAAYPARLASRVSIVRAVAAE